MVSLTDLAPSTRTVSVGGSAVSVQGISILGIAALLRDYPNLKDAFTGGGLKFDMASLADVGPGIVAAVIAAGCGSPGDPAAVAIAASLPLSAQVEFLDAITDLTMPDGIGPFMEALDSMIARLGLADRGKAPASI